MYNSGNSGFGSIPPVVKNIMIICGIMLLAKYVLQFKFGTDLDSILGLYYFKSENFKIYQFVTYLFMHADFFHIFFNMFAFYMFGKILEITWGSQRFLIFFLVTGIGAALIQQVITHIELTFLFNKISAYSNTPSFDAFELFVNDNIKNPSLQLTDFIDNWRKNETNPIYISDSVAILNKYYSIMSNIPMIGASGSVYGILLAFGMLYPNVELVLLFPPIPVKAKWMVMAYGAIELYLGLSQPGSNVAHFAHLGGMLFGFILIKLWNTKKPDFY
jgi:membrane associated rhomboid family serine protease